MCQRFFSEVAPDFGSTCDESTRIRVCQQFFSEVELDFGSQFAESKRVRICQRFFNEMEPDSGYIMLSNIGTHSVNGFSISLAAFC